MKRHTTRLAPLAALLICCLTQTSCQPPHGVLMPVGQAGAKLSTTRYVNDTAEVSSGNLVIKVFGEWESPDSFYLTLAVENTGGQPVSLDFKAVELINSRGAKATLAGLGERQSFDDARRFNLYTANPRSNTDPSVTIAAREQKIFDAVYGYRPGRESDIVVGEAVSLHVPSAADGSAAGKIVLTFKCAEMPGGAAREVTTPSR